MSSKEIFSNESAELFAELTAGELQLLLLRHVSIHTSKEIIIFSADSGNSSSASNPQPGELGICPQIGS